MGAFVSAALGGRADCTGAGALRRSLGAGTFSTGRADVEDAGSAFVVALAMTPGTLALGATTGNGGGGKTIA